MLVDVPIEPLEERYSTQWRRWFARELNARNIEWLRVNGSMLTLKIENGSFLDVHGTNFFKANQLMCLMDLLKAGEVKDGDWIFFHDLWFPGIEMLAYVRDAMGTKFRIAGCLHAGTWDRHDFTRQRGMRKWAHHFERALCKIADEIFVATPWHKLLISDDIASARDKITVTGFPIYPQDFTKQSEKEPGLVVFPHRLDPEKGVAEWNLLCHSDLSTRGFRFAQTKTACKTKEEYYALLAQAEFAVSFAEQETWGIAMQEALFSGCVSLCPRRLSYTEMYDPLLLHDGVEGVRNTLIAARTSHSVNVGLQAAAERTRKDLEKGGREAIPNMLKVMGL